MVWVIDDALQADRKDTKVWGPIIASELAGSSQNKTLDVNADLAPIGGNQVWKVLWARMEIDTTFGGGTRVQSWEILDAANDIVFGAQGSTAFNLGASTIKIAQWGRYGELLAGQTSASTGPHEFAIPELWLGHGWSMRFFSTGGIATDDMLIHLGLLRDNGRRY